MACLRVDDYSGISSYLESVPFNCLFARSVVERVADGDIWVDDEKHPAIIHIINVYSMSLLIVLDVNAHLDSLLAHFEDWRRNRGGLWLQLHPREFASRLEGLIDADISPSHPLPDGVNVQRFTRVNFRFEPKEYAIRRANLPDIPCAVVRLMTTAEFAMPGITVSPHMFWRSGDQFLINGGGWCVTGAGDVSSIAFTSFRKDSALELGVETRPEYRGKGHARIACSALIDQCLASGLLPLWSCRKENAASYNLARSLGFAPALELPYYRLPPKVS